LTAKPHQLFGAAGGAGGNALHRTINQQLLAAAVLTVQWQDASGGLMFHQLPVGGVAAGRSEW